MKYEILISRGAAEIVADARDYYDLQAVGLGERFQHEVDNLLDRLQFNPFIYPVTSVHPYRKGQLRVFPYLVYYRITDAVVRVVAVEHARREPGRWLKQLRD